MTIRTLAVRVGTAVTLATAIAACSSIGNVGDILGSVLGGGQAAEVAGTIRGVDAQSQQISVEQSNGQAVSLMFDNQTRVVYQNRTYPVTSLDPGDQVQARVQQQQDGSYYTDSVNVIQPVNGGSTTSGGSGAVQSLQGTVRQLDKNNGMFTIDAGSNVILTVSLPYNANSTIVSRFNALRSGDYVRFYGVYLSSSRVELRQFN